MNAIAVDPVKSPGVDRLLELEQVIERGLETFVDVGLALMEIRDSRLYRESHSSFELYCRERWQMNDRRASQFIRASQVVRELPTNVGIPKNEATARELAPLLDTPEDLTEVWRELQARHGDKLTAEKVRVAVDERLAFERKVGTLKSSNSVEWYTPSRYVEAAREVLGAIDLDPASCAQANEVVGAEVFYDAAADGLSRDWHGCVWMNPPYGAICGQFVHKLVGEYQSGNVTAAIALLNAYSTDVRWFQCLWDYPLCFTDHRINFTSPLHGVSGPTTGSVFVYLGPDRHRFVDVFSQFGAVVERSSLEVAA